MHEPMPHVESIVKRAEAQCKERGVRMTPKRKQVLSALIRSESAMSAYELADYCQREYGQSMPAMSVYRILDFLEAERFAHKLNVANKYIACAHIACGHEHDVAQFLICSRCLRVEEITVSKSAIDELQRSVDAAGFSLVTPQLEMNCVCDKCDDKAN